MSLRTRSSTVKSSNAAVSSSPSDHRSSDEKESVAVVIPCRNEARSIAKVVGDFRRVLPHALILVVDNASTDDTGKIALEAGATVVRESRRGKGFAVVRGFRETWAADYVILVDGDDTYPAESVHDLLQGVREGADMTIGTRMHSFDDGAYRVGHTFGNKLFIWLVRLLFGARTQDLFSGYRAFTKRFLYLSPLIAQGFEIEAELSMQALAGGFVVSEVPVHYRARGEGSTSKLNTVRDGYRILIALLAFFRDYRPLTCFGSISLLLFLLSGISGSTVVGEYLRTGQILRIPTAILSVGLGVLGAITLIGGVLLSSVNRRSQELAALLLIHRPRAN
jgi:glycosyltransferase involved in cell wall biosynthesis